jgi:diadenosine tetraphosphate (Ap4A) HIT family hydrolase
MGDDCYSCRMNAIVPANLPPRECVLDDGHWRVAHAIGSGLVGWMVIVPHRHISSLSEMTPDEADALGPLMQRLSTAVEVVTGAMKCYVVFLAEAPGFRHVHLHVIPRLVDAPPERVGIGVMQYLAVPNSEWVSHDEMDSISTRIREYLERRPETATPPR